MNVVCYMYVCHIRTCVCNTYVSMDVCMYVCVCACVCVCVCIYIVS